MTETKVECRGVASRSALRARVMAAMADVLAALPRQPTSARVAFSDVNGPKGGDAIHCALEVRLPQRRTVHVEDVASTPRLAFAAGLTKLERRLRRTRETARESKRRPKKYFAARRVLAGK